MATGYTDTATTNFDKTVTALVIRTILSNLRNKLVWLHPGAYVTGTIIPGTNLLRYINYADLDVTTNSGTVTPGTAPWLEEGVPPDPTEMAIDYDEATAYQAGRVIRITDVALKESPHALVEVAAEKVAHNALATIDLYIAGVFAAGTSETWAGAEDQDAHLQSTDELNAAEVKLVVAAMKSANIPTFPDGTYHAIVHPNAAYDLMADTADGGWIDASRYAQPGKFLTGELGRFAGVTFIESNVGTYLGTIGDTSAKVYRTTFMGPECFAFGDLQSVESYFVRPGGDHADPLAQSAMVGWKAAFGAALFTASGSAPRYLALDSGATL